MPTNRTRQIAFRWFGWYFLIMFLELLTTPGVSPSNSWQGVWISFLLLLAGTVDLSQKQLRNSQLFLFGCGASILFVPRFLGMDRFSLWLVYQAPDLLTINLCWVAFALFQGAVCYGIGLLYTRTIRRSE